jgi:hypothetical protein
VRQTDSLFPYDDGYRAWVGQCSTAEPATSDPIDVDAGQTTTAATQPAAALRFSVVDSLGVLQSGWELTITNLDCSESFHLGTSTTTPVALSLPAGQWRIKAFKASQLGTQNVTLTADQILHSGTPVEVEV